MAILKMSPKWLALIQQVKPQTAYDLVMHGDDPNLRAWAKEYSTDDMIPDELPEGFTDYRAAVLVAFAYYYTYEFPRGTWEPRCTACLGDSDEHAVNGKCLYCPDTRRYG